MFGRDITYKNIHGTEVTRKFWFHLFPAEIAVLEMSYNGGITGFIDRISQTQDHGTLLKEFKDLICLCYGVRDGDDFLKSEDLTARFIGSGAYSALFMEFISDSNSASDFIKGVVPQEIKDLPDLPVPSSNPIPPPPMPATTVEAGKAIAQDAGM